MNFVELLFLFISICSVSIYLFIKYRHRYWKNKAVPYIKPTQFLLGNTADVILHGIPLVEYHKKLYNELESHKFGGYFNFLSPVLIIRDPEIIRNILTKDFHHFMNRGTSFMDEDEPLTLHLFNLSGEKWKNLRTKLTPTFTSGKIKIMFNLMKQCSEELVNVINETTKEEECIDVKEMMSRFTTDIISSCVFGLDSQSLNNSNSVFRRMGKDVFSMSLQRRIIGFLNSFSPQLRRFLKLKLINREVTEFFKSLVVNTIEYRKKNNITRNDFLDLLISLRNSPKTLKPDEQHFALTDNLLTAQCFVFFIAGFETSSGTLSFALCELAKNQNIQEKVREEVDRIFGEHGNQLAYEGLQQMTYLDMVISDNMNLKNLELPSLKILLVVHVHELNDILLRFSEVWSDSPYANVTLDFGTKNYNNLKIQTLRMYPILPVLIRVCNKNYELPDTHVTIEEGTRIIIPVLGLHYDSKYYTNPLEFNPENFSKEAKSLRHHYVYLPFGEGPRICIGVLKFGHLLFLIGMRFGLMQVKLGLAVLIRNYYFKLSSKMNVPLEFDKRSFLLNVNGGVWLTTSRRHINDCV